MIHVQMRKIYFIAMIAFQVCDCRLVGSSALRQKKLPFHLINGSQIRSSNPYQERESEPDISEKILVLARMHHIILIFIIIILCSMTFAESVRHMRRVSHETNLHNVDSCFFLLSL